MITLETLRQFRFNDYAIFDFTISFLGIYLLSPLLSRLFLLLNLKIPKTSWLLLTLPISILAHLLIGQATLMTQNFIDPQGHYGLKITILILLFLGVKGIKINQ